jgi:hypothetical protein
LLSAQFLLEGESSKANEIYSQTVNSGKNEWENGLPVGFLQEITGGGAGATWGRSLDDKPDQSSGISAA